MENKLIKKINLENKQELKIFDKSRKISSDSCLIKLILRMDIIIKNHLKKMNQDEIHQIIKTIGDKVKFEIVLERNFILNNETKISDSFDHVLFFTFIVCCRTDSIQSSSDCRRRRV